LLGKFESFPEIVHKEKTFKTNLPTKKVQKRILKKFYSLNGKEFPSSYISNALGSNFIVIFEFGVAEGINFNYLDRSELNRYLKSLKSKNFKTLDFFLVNRYYKTRKEGRKTPLKFDYQLLRFEFPSKHLKIKVYHERGPQRIPLEELIEFLAKQTL
jgi:hypothetical protein